MLTALAPPAQVDRMIAGFAARIPSGRIASPDDIANAVVFLASDESSFINGIDLAVDGGMAQI
jgi:NAD(P)-dependent dehydrogenase (short-subunit alcohol dehydrogenase family)